MRANIYLIKCERAFPCLFLLTILRKATVTPAGSLQVGKKASEACSLTQAWVTNKTSSGVSRLPVLCTNQDSSRALWIMKSY